MTTRRDETLADGRATIDEKAKERQLDVFREDPDGTTLTTNQGVPVSDTADSLTAGTRGPMIRSMKDAVPA